MKKTSLLTIALCMGVLVFEMLFGDPTAYAEGKKDEAKQSSELMTRIDFGNSYITGQTLKSGAVYLLQRKKSDVKSMLKYREDYRKEILEAHDIRKKDDMK
jgi:hypothetical protein